MVDPSKPGLPELPEFVGSSPVIEPCLPGTKEDSYIPCTVWHLLPLLEVLVDIANAFLCKRKVILQYSNKIIKALATHTISSLI